MRNIFLSIFAILVATLMPSEAEAQYQYDGDDFYIKVSGPAYIQIGLKGDSLFYHVGGNRKMDVEIYAASIALEGYKDIPLDEVDDPDFIINDKANEMCSENRKEARSFIKALSRIKTKASLRVDIHDTGMYRNVRHKYLTLDRDAINAIVSAYKAL